MLPQLLDLPHTPWRGVIKGPGTAVPAEVLRPVVEWIADKFGDSAEGRMARWVDVAPRLTPSSGSAGGAGRQLRVDQIDGLLTILERLPVPEISASTSAMWELAGPIVQDPASASALAVRIRQEDQASPRASAAGLFDALLRQGMSALPLIA